MGTVLHQRLQLGQSLLDLGHRSGAVNELAVLGIVLLIGHNEGQERDRLARPRRHFQHAVASGIERAFEIAHVCILFGVDARVWKQYR